MGVNAQACAVIIQPVMPDLAKKLGLRPGDLVCVLDAPPEAVEALRGVFPPGVQEHKALLEMRYNVILFWPRQSAGLTERFAGLQAHMQPDGSLWAVIPKKKYAPARGVSLTWEELQAAALRTDLVDNKVASITEQDYGTRFVIRKARRIV
jgi:hypothetical protein